VGVGARLVDQAGATMNDVVASVARVSSIITDITASSQAQCQGIANTNNAIRSMDEATHQNAALVEEASAAAASLGEQAGNLAQAMEVFRLDGDAAPALAPVRGIDRYEPKRMTRPAPPRSSAEQLKIA
jgi:methyl-accepting chemotaxis protein